MRPWTYEYENDHGPCYQVVGPRLSFPWHATESDPQRIQAEADARLMSAAPELLDACYNLLDALADDPRHRAVIAEARAAIAKAAFERTAASLSGRLNP